MRQARGEARFINLYGPTEATVDATWAALDSSREPSIGTAASEHAGLAPRRSSEARPAGVRRRDCHRRRRSRARVLEAARRDGARVHGDRQSQGKRERVYKTGDFAQVPRRRPSGLSRAARLSDQAQRPAHRARRSRSRSTGARSRGRSGRGRGRGQDRRLVRVPGQSSASDLPERSRRESFLADSCPTSITSRTLFLAIPAARSTTRCSRCRVAFLVRARSAPCACAHRESTSRRSRKYGRSSWALLPRTAARTSSKRAAILFWVSGSSRESRNGSGSRSTSPCSPRARPRDARRCSRSGRPPRPGDLVSPGLDVAKPLSFSFMLREETSPRIASVVASAERAPGRGTARSNPIAGELSELWRSVHATLPREQLYRARTSYLAGWSLGGVVALEIARALRERGILVPLVLLLDSRLPVGAGAASTNLFPS